MHFDIPARKLRILTAIAAVALLSACTTPNTPGGVNDPWEGANRAVHNFNKGFDRAIASPSAKAYVTIFPRPVTRGVTRFSTNLELPGRIVNSVLQLRLKDAGHNTMRFLTNSTFGLLGFLDPASEMGLGGVETDFGETLFVWGVGEGPFVELPFFGPHTSRAAVGFLVDFVNSPVLNAIDTVRGRNVRYGAFVLDQLESRADFDAFFRDIYDSADSYSQARIIYLQNRRFELGRGEQDDYLDPYEDGGTLLSDEQYVDPYEDPYAQ